MTAKSTTATVMPSTTKLTTTTTIASATNKDECDLGEDDCHNNAVCTDTDGSFTCACKSGYSGDGKTCTKKPVEYVVVTAANGTAHASSVYSGNYKPIEAFTNQAGDYWCSIKKTQAPVCLWFQFNE